MKSIPFRLHLLFLTSFTAAASHAEVKPNPLFTDGAVLQRDQELPVWGTAGNEEKVTVESGKAILGFSHAGGGLVAKDGPLKGFAIAGPNKTFVPARAEIRDGEVVLSADSVAAPVAVRYDWRTFEGNLFNAEKIPASPFRTDLD